MNTEISRKLAARYLINILMEDNYELLECMEDPENEEQIMGKNCQGQLKKIECLLVQIQKDSERGNQRSMFRKLLLLRGLLRTGLK